MLLGYRRGDRGTGSEWRSLAGAAVLALAAVATIGYLWALSRGSASVILPFVAVAPALGGMLGAIALGERTTRTQRLGIAVGLVGAVLLAMGGAGR